MADTSGLHEQFGTAIQALVNASGGRIWINSGFRTVERQAQLYEAAVNKYGDQEARNHVAPPGRSNHNFGLAVDLGGDLDLAHQLAPRFGLTFPMSWEPWHIEPTWARQERGEDYKGGILPPPAGVSHDEDPMSSIHNQIANFTALIQGVAPNMLEAQWGRGTPSDMGTIGGAAVGSSGKVDPASLYAMLKAQGLDPVHAAALVAIAGRESGYDPAAFNGDRSTGDESYGLFQINKLGGMHSQWSGDELKTVEGAVSAAATLVEQSGLHPWGGYKGVSWSRGTDLDAAAAATSGEVTVGQLQALEN